MESTPGSKAHRKGRKSDGKRVELMRVELEKWRYSDNGARETCEKGSELRAWPHSMKTGLPRGQDIPTFITRLFLYLALDESFGLTHPHLTEGPAGRSGQTRKASTPGCKRALSAIRTAINSKIASPKPPSMTTSSNILERSSQPALQQQIPPPNPPKTYCRTGAATKINREGEGGQKGGWLSRRSRTLA